MLLAGIDLGTTNCRCLLVDEGGSVVAAASREVPLVTSPPDRAEVQPERWWEATVDVVADALAAGGASGQDVVAVGLSGLMHAPVLVDGSGRSLRPAPLWLDQRCAPQARDLERRFAGRRPPLDLRSSVTAPKIRWMAEHDPGALAAARTVLLPKDFVRFRLTGETATDLSDALGTGMYDPTSGRWRDDVAREVGLRTDQLPPVHRADELAGRVTKEAAHATGLVAGTPVAIGGSDTLCARLGTGPLPPGTTIVYLGTAAWVAVVDGTDATSGIRATDTGATTSTGAALRWTRDLLAGGSASAMSYRDLDALASAVPPGSAGVLFFPHLMGERGPETLPFARGAWTGLTLAHTRGHLVRSVLEGTAFQLRHVLQAPGSTDGARGTAAAAGTGSAAAVPPSARVIGGICSSELWLQIVSDVTGVTLRVPAEPETPARGAALLGARARGVVAPTTVWDNPVVRVVTPDPGRHATYDSAYARYLALDRALLA